MSNTPSRAGQTEVNFRYDKSVECTGEQVLGALPTLMREAGLLRSNVGSVLHPKMPQLPEMPGINIPQLSELPEIEMPEMPELPEMQIPQFPTFRRSE